MGSCCTKDAAADENGYVPPSGQSSKRRTATELRKKYSAGEKDSAAAASKDVTAGSATAAKSSRREAPTVTLVDAPPSSSASSGAAAGAAAQKQQPVSPQMSPNRKANIELIQSVAPMLEPVELSQTRPAKMIEDAMMINEKKNVVAASTTKTTDNNNQRSPRGGGGGGVENNKDAAATGGGGKNAKVEETTPPPSLASFDDGTSTSPSEVASPPQLSKTIVNSASVTVQVPSAAAAQQTVAVAQVADATQSAQSTVTVAAAAAAAGAISLPPPPPPPPRVTNVLASLLPTEDVNALRKAKENEADRPKMIEFDVNFDDDDLIAVEHMGDEGEIVEDFSVDDDTPQKHQPSTGATSVASKNGEDNSSILPTHPGSKVLATKGSDAVFDGIEKKTSAAPDQDFKLDLKWFQERGVQPPQSIDWKQTKTHVMITIRPADADSGWELSSDGALLDFTSSAKGRNTKVVLALLHPLRNATFDLDLQTSELRFTGEKIPLSNDDDEEDTDSGAAAQPASSSFGGYQYWTQLIRGSRKDYGALTFIHRLIDDDDDEEEQAPPYEYGRNPPPNPDDGAFSDPEDD